MPGLSLTRGRHGGSVLVAVLVSVLSQAVLSQAVDAAPARSAGSRDRALSIVAPLPPVRPPGLGVALPHEQSSPSKASASPDPQGCLKAFEALGGEILPTEPSGTSGDCAVAEPVTFRQVKLPDGSSVALEGAVTMRCSLALELSGWIRDDLAAIAARQGSALVRLNGVGGQACRPRNGQPGGQISEHASGNAFDLQALTLADKRVIRLGASDAGTKTMREQVRAAACARFRTVLGPGSDSFHADHLHVDMRQRKGDFKLCQWEVK